MLTTSGITKIKDSDEESDPPKAAWIFYTLPHLALSSYLAAWHWKGSSYPPSRTEVYESDASAGTGSVFEVRGPAKGGRAGPRAPDRIGAWPPPAISTWSVK